MTDIVINAERCIGCGACVRDCLRELLTVEGGKAQVREGFCIRCGHCAAVCPADAIRLSGCPEDELLPYKPSEFDIPPQKLLNFLKFRRSVRQFQSRPVDADMLAALLEAARYAPTGGNQQMNRYILLEERREAVIQLVLQTLYDAVQRLDEEPALQELRPYQPLCTGMYRAWQERREDRLLYGAPCVLLTVARRPQSVSGRVDGALASANLELMAHALGLGACYVGFVGIAAGLNPDVRKLLGVRKKEELISTLAIGHPAVRYHRTVSRQSADLTRL